MSSRWWRGWVEVPINHADYTVDPGVGDNEYDQDEFNRLMSSRMESIVQLVVAQLPKDLDYAAADGIFLYWSPEMFAFKQTISDNDGVFQTPQGRQQIPVQGGGVFQTTDTGSLTFEIKKEYAWTYFLHEFMHWKGMNGHAPGNGWKTGIGQGAYPGGSGEYSGAIGAWEVFLYEWWEESQVFCADLESFEDPQRVILSLWRSLEGSEKWSRFGSRITKYWWSSPDGQSAGQKPGAPIIRDSWCTRWMPMASRLIMFLTIAETTRRTRNGPITSIPITWATPAVSLMTSPT